MGYSCSPLVGCTTSQRRPTACWPARDDVRSQSETEARQGDDARPVCEGARRRLGWWLRPFGYRITYDVAHRDGRPRGRLEVDPAEAEIIRRVFRSYADGRTDEQGDWIPLSQHAAARQLNEMGHTIRVRQARCLHIQVGLPRPFEVLDIRRILRQRPYLGFYRSRREAPQQVGARG